MLVFNEEKKMKKKLDKLSCGYGMLFFSVLLYSSTGIAATEGCIPGNCDGYTKSSADCKGKTAIKCPFDTSKLYCQDDTECGDAYKYACTGEGYAGGVGDSCGGKYSSCSCSSGYLWKNERCTRTSFKIKLCIDIKNKANNRTIEPFCGFQALMIEVDGKYYLSNGGPTYTGPSTIEKGCVEETIDIPNGAMTFRYLPDQSTTTCGYYTIYCEKADSEFNYEGLRQKSVVTEGAYEKYEFEVLNDATLDVTYNCTVKN